MFLSFSSGLWTEPQSEGEVKHSLCPDRPLPRQQTQPGPPPVQERERQRRGDRDRGRCRVAGILPWSQRSGGEAEERFCQGGSGVWVSGRCNTHTHEHTQLAGHCWTHWSGLLCSSSSSSSRADLVPVYSFGENELFRQVIFSEGSFSRRCQDLFKNIMGFAPCLFVGGKFGVLPYRTPVTTVGECCYYHDYSEESGHRGEETPHWFNHKSIQTTTKNIYITYNIYCRWMLPEGWFIYVMRKHL